MNLYKYKRKTFHIFSISKLFGFLSCKYKFKLPNYSNLSERPKGPPKERALTVTRV